MPKSRSVDADVLMEQLFRLSDLETRIPLNMNVLDGGLIPRVMSLKDALVAFINHRRNVLERRSQHRLEKIAARLVVLEGYLAVYLNLDKVIHIIRTEDEPKPKLMKAFGLTEVQAEAILNMRLRSLRKLEEIEIRAEHANLTKEQKEIRRLLGSDTLKSERLVDEVKAVDVKFGQKTELGKRRTTFSSLPEIGADVDVMESLIEREPVTVVCSEKGWVRSFKGHQEPSDAVKYREGDRERFWVHAETTDKLMLFATDGRFFTLDCSKLPGGRGNGEAIRSFIDLPPEADLVSMFVHKDGRKLLLAATSGHGFVTGENEAVALKRSGKQVMTVPTGTEAVVCRFVEGDTVAVIGENRKLLLFALEEVPELARGRGVILQRFKDGHLLDVCMFKGKEGFRDINNRTWTLSELKEWKGARAQAGRLVPRGFAKSGKFG
jgi:topoisomerase-4 subunit A